MNRTPPISGPGDDELISRLLPLLTRPTGRTSAGYPYLERQTFEEFRDTIPHLFACGSRVLATLEHLEGTAESLPGEDAENLNRAIRVARQIVYTAAITAPTDLWLLRHILGTFAELGLSERLLAGDAIDPARCQVELEGGWQKLDEEQLAIDLHFLLSRGLVEQYDRSFRIAGHPRVRALFQELGPIPAEEPIPATNLWRALFCKSSDFGDKERRALLTLANIVPEPRQDLAQNHWLPTVDEVKTGYLLVPLILGLRAANLTANQAHGALLYPRDLSDSCPDCADLALQILRAAGWVESDGPAAKAFRITALGARGFARGPGPFGIIQTYVSYMKQARQILLQGRRQVWVRRGENIGASQDANRATFKKANDALDRFCKDTGFRYSIFIEHAIGRGEATRQRFERCGEDNIRYFGADLEDPAIDAAIAEQKAGHLPANMIFVRNADIGIPQILTEAIEKEGLDPFGAVMLVGNGFHEVRDQTDESIIEVFRGYHEAGILLLFTEENALSIDDLRATAFNTYHAGFKYVHEKSGQCLRPASPSPRPRYGPPLRAAWSECAAAAGYIRLDAYSDRTRTIYPYPREDGHNPSISVNHFFVPKKIAEDLGSSISQPEQS